jgi:hypothetical protein
MPYIKTNDRIKLDELIEQLSENIGSSGELNYVVTKLLHLEVRDGGGLNYENLNRLMGVMECAKSEFYRQVVVPYENKKIEENGDVTLNP